MAASFKEIARIEVSEATSATVSSVTEGSTLKGYNLTKFVASAKYTGYTPGGLFIPADKLNDFKKMVAGL